MKLIASLFATLIVALIVANHPFDAPFKIEHTQRIEAAQTERPTEAPSPAPAQPKAVQSVPLTWYDSELQDAGIVLPAGTIVALTNQNNCGAALSTVGRGGCTLNNKDGVHKIIVISPALANTTAGKHILLHEAGHALGISDECEAEYFAHNHGSDPNYWAYPSCEEAAGN